MVETLRKESVYRWEKLDLGKTKGSHFKRLNPKERAKFYLKYTTKLRFIGTRIEHIQTH